MVSWEILPTVRPKANASDPMSARCARALPFPLGPPICMPRGTVLRGRSRATLPLQAVLLAFFHHIPSNNLGGFMPHRWRKTAPSPPPAFDAAAVLLAPTQHVVSQRSAAPSIHGGDTAQHIHPSAAAATAKRVVARCSMLRLPCGNPCALRCVRACVRVRACVQREAAGRNPCCAAQRLRLLCEPFAVRAALRCSRPAPPCGSCCHQTPSMRRACTPAHPPASTLRVAA